MKKLRCSLAVLAAIGLAAGSGAAQTPAAGLSFEVASIKPAPPMNPQAMMAGKMHVGTKIDAARVDIGFASLADLIRTAYNVKPYQVIGPDWLKTERFDIMAKMPEGATKEQVPEMLKALLIERFGMTVHKDSKPQSVYALVMAKTGSKLKDAVPDPVAAPVDPSAPPPAPAKGEMTMSTAEGDVKVKPSGDGRGATISSSRTGNMKMSMGQDGLMHLEASSMSMTTLAETITPFLDKPVLDETGLKGKYQVALDLSMADMMKVARASGMMGAGGPIPGAPAETASDPAGGSIFTAIQQLGLKLESRKDPVETIVVDHIEKTPTGN